MTRNVRKDLDYVNGMEAQVLDFDRSSGGLLLRTVTGHTVSVWRWTDPDRGGLSYYPVRPGYASTILKSRARSCRTWWCIWMRRRCPRPHTRPSAGLASTTTSCWPAPSLRSTSPRRTERGMFFRVWTGDRQPRRTGLPTRRFAMPAKLLRSEPTL